METESRPPRRSLRPRQERSYAESPDVFILSDDEPRINGFSNGFDVEVDSDEELPPLPSPPIKELNEAELEEKERVLRKLREELRNEEMKLVLLKKLKQSQQMKENIAVLPASHGSSASKKLPPPQSAPPPLMRASKPASGVPPLLRGVSRNFLLTCFKAYLLRPVLSAPFVSLSLFLSFYCLPRVEIIIGKEGLVNFF